MEKRTERQNILSLVERLAAQFPLEPHSRVEQIVETEYAKLTGRPVRQYVANLVEHAAKIRLVQVATFKVAV